MRQYLAGTVIATVVLLGLGLFYLTFVTDTAEASLTENVLSPTGESIEGDWVIEKSSLEDGSEEILTDGFNQTFAGYRVSINGPVPEAVGRTSEVSGGISIRNNTVSADIAISTEKFTSKSDLQDSAFAESISSGDFPLATFKLDRPLQIDPSLLQLRALTTGTLELAGESRSIETMIEAQLITDPEVLAKFSESERVIQVVVSANIDFTDFGIESPSTADVLVPDTGTIEALINLVPAE